MKAYIWTLPTRIFHWMLVFYILLMFITSKEENLLDYHAAFGYGIMILILFRLIWGVMGPRYSRFSQWPLSIKEAIGFVCSLSNPKKYYEGHNPAASFVILGIILVILLSNISGVLAYGIQEGKGLFAWLNGTFFKEMELFEEIHDLFSTLLLLLIGAHLGGITVDYFLHKKSGTLSSIFSGYKNIEAPSARLRPLQKFVAFVFLTAALLMPFYVMFSNTPMTQSRYSAINYEKEHPLFVEECASCHILYPPHLLPKRSWKKLMVNLADHFGDDASLDETDRRSIEAYLLKHSAENSTKEAAFYISQSMKKADIIAITKTSYWEKRHASIHKVVFESSKVKSRANCKACHREFDKGIIDDALITIPKGV
jgi:cytochrome b